MIQLTIPTTFTSDFLNKVVALNSQFADTGNRIFELYGSFQQASFNSARPAKYLPDVTREQFQRHVREARLKDLSFNYLFNAPSYANFEYTHQGRTELEEILRFLVDCGVKSVTVTIPYLVDIIHSSFPELEIVVSTIGYVNAMRGFNQFHNAGAQRVVLDVEANRDFHFLKNSVQRSPLPVELIVNTVCLYQCHYKYNHYSVAAFGSQNSPRNATGTPYNQYYLNWCFLQKLKRDGEFLKSPWLRPEDLPLWENIGIQFFKIAGRGLPAEEILRLSRAYLSGKFTGNLLDLLGWPHWKQFQQCKDGSLLDELDIVVDNAKLDGFLDFFAKTEPDCRMGCEQCGHCLKWSNRAVDWSSIDLRKKYIDNMERNLRKLVNHIPSSSETASAEKRWIKQAGKQVVKK
jgi:collagenase-like PrtC family protease